ARRTSFYLAAEEELIKWLNELQQIEIAVISDSIKMQMYTILLTTCADKYPDSFKGYLTDIVKNKCAVNNIHKAIILGGLTSIVQPLDEKWHLWMSKEVWDDISAEMIIKSFKKCGISNELDRIEDDLLYNSDQENSEIDDNEDLFEVVEEDSLSAEELED
ncbi:8167_t:CDS:2, partial [Scutellospora calospora]